MIVSFLPCECPTLVVDNELPSVSSSVFSAATHCPAYRPAHQTATNMAAWAIRLLLAALPTFTAALQVTPNSPCASFCLDDGAQDISDPNSSNTNGSEIVCADGDFSSQAAGQKFQQCLGCLQDSAFIQDPENDQQWFFCTSDTEQVGSTPEYAGANT